jgi:hypothetical protein
MNLKRFHYLKQEFAGRSLRSLQSHLNEFLVAVLLFTVCFLITVCGYSCYAPRQEKNPPRVLFSTNGGEVLFPHRHHSDVSGGGFDCTECHHNEESDIDSLVQMSCRECHYRNPEIVEIVCADDTTHPRCIGKKCQSCHEGEECTFCHRKNH